VPAADVADAPTAEFGAGQMALLIPVANDTYAVPLSSVREVVVGPKVTPLPTAPETVRGVFNLRGDVVPLFDTARVLGLPSTPGELYAVLVETDHGVAGLLATDMPVTVRLHESVGHSDLEGTTETYLVGELRLAVGLDLNVLLDPVRMSQ
jgi:purine-binding chemotaxis protein CheW